jgi:two-component system, chemotaxis family, chemotaxis protein CheY
LVGRADRPALPGPDGAGPTGLFSQWGTARGMAFDPTTAVLVVDDSATAIRIVRKLLWQLGFISVDDASDGATALNAMRAKRYGLVISDWNMAPMTGYEFLREVRADPTLARTPFIIITADSKIENLVAANRASVSSCIIKPFDAKTLKAKIDAVFAAKTPLRT